MLSCRCLIAAAVLVLTAGLAISAGGKPRGADHEWARQAFQRGEIRSLSDILVELKSQIAGEVINNT